MSFGRGRLSRSSWAGAVSSSSMISLHRSMHSSQMWTPGPAISFLTCRWLLPQKLQSSCSFPSDARATFLLLAGDGLGVYPVRDHVVDDAVLLGFLCGEEVVALHVPRDLFVRASGVQRQDLLEPALERNRLARLDLDVGRLPLEPTGHLMDEDLGVRQSHPLSFRSSREEHCAHRHRDADADRLHVTLDVLHRVV